MYYLYFIYNQVNNKIYIGITNNIKKRWSRHKSISRSKKLCKQHIHHAICKYGLESFVFKQVEILDDFKTANNREVEWIDFLRKEGYHLYNETNRGEGSLGIQKFGSDNPNFEKAIKPHVKEQLLKARRKLNDKQIKEINDLYSSGNYSQTQLSKQFNVSLTQIHRIVNGKSWGNKNHDTILTKKNLSKDDVIKIKEMYLSGNYLQKEIAIIFNVSPNHISRIVNGKRWKTI